MRRFVAVFVATVAGLVVLLSFKSAPAKAPRPAALSGTTPEASSSAAASSAAASSAPPSSAAPGSAAPGSTAPGSTAPSSAAPSSAAPSSAATTAPSASSTTTKTVTGSAVTVSEGRRSFGVVQVRLTLTNGKITAATAVQEPEDDSHSAEISQFSIPVLSREVLSAQSASIDAVSGATYTSDAYAQSVQAALDAAKA
jgi:uncharacterized protein with FMN-binding domain